MEIVKEKLTFKKFFNTLFGENEFEEDIKLPGELKTSQEKVGKMAEVVNAPINEENKKASKNGGFSAGLKINQATLNKMRETHNELIKGEERGE